MAAPRGPAVSRRRLGVLGASLAAAGFAASRETVMAATDGGPAFPLAVGRDRRRLVDASGKPFLLVGDTAWSLMAQLDEPSARLYLGTRQKQGFSAILGSLIEHRFATQAPANAAGEQPFTAPGRFDLPNEAYFGHVERVVRHARDLGLLMLLVPSYLGFEGGPEGWYKDVEAAGPEVMRGYGAWLGRRFKGLDNIVWVQGGDHAPARRELVQALAAGLAEADPRALQSAHCGPGQSGRDFWDGEPWLAFDTLYTYASVRDAAAASWARRPPLPFILFEAAYENEQGATRQRLRAQAWEAMLGGATGHIYGNNPIWHFDGPGLYAAPGDWRQEMSSGGAADMQGMTAFLRTLDWAAFQPDGGTLLADEPGGRRPPSAALRSDRRQAMVYLQDRRPVAIDLGALSGQQVALDWYAPALGRMAETGRSVMLAEGSMSLRPPSAPAGTSEDWLALLTAVS